MADGGKGSSPRPFVIPKEEYAQRFDAIFEKTRKHCDVCSKVYAWCQCVSAPKELCEAIDKALGIKRKKKND
jgi:hypothetical protein